MLALLLLSTELVVVGRVGLIPAFSISVEEHLPRSLGRVTVLLSAEGLALGKRAVLRPVVGLKFVADIRFWIRLRAGTKFSQESSGEMIRWYELASGFILS